MSQVSEPGTLALVGGSEWTDGCSFDEALWKSSGAAEVLVMPTAAAYEHPQREVERAEHWFAAWGVPVEGLGLLNRRDALDEGVAAKVRAARFIYIGGGSSMHLRSVLKDTPTWTALVDAWREGATLAASSAGAMVLGDSMVDPRGGALTLGLGLVEHIAFLPHYDTWSEEKAQRTVQLATGHLRIAAIDERTVLLLAPDGSWSVEGAGDVRVYVDAKPAGLEALSNR